MAQENSFEYKVAKNRYQSNKWNYANFKASFLPTLILDGTIPNYSRSINRITLPNGEDAFVNQNQAYSNLNLNIRQNVAATGGVISVGSTLNRIDVLGRNRQTNYSVIPASISYTQNTIGFNSFKWLKKTEPLKLESSTREFATNMEEIGSQTVESFFKMIAGQTQKELSLQNLLNIDTLIRIANDRFKLGTVTRSELLQLELNALNAQTQLRKDSLEFELARQQFSRYLAIDNLPKKLDIPDKIRFYEINPEEAIRQAKENGLSGVDFKLKRLEAERNVAQVSAESKLKFNIQANFGFSNTSERFQRLFIDLASQQNISLGFSVPLLDWGFAKTQRLRAEANLDMVKSIIAQDQMKLEQTVSMYVSMWNLHQRNVAAVVKAREISQSNYELELQRYRAGHISTNDLNAAQSQKDNATNAYVQALKTYWELHFAIRRYTLFDFERKEKITMALSN